ncbi:helix-turn-helix transcriptional regulator [Butyrivibrio sp. AE3006]|uniref:helix-turn-helix transcriptional regulator n=1 Tax=Butyrivibrio sp. AE3006 TaxID=1280673 RepID=UPI0004288D2A|nr:response regulator transcription factor [Butyrivibrio sp. AE3006]
MSINVKGVTINQLTDLEQCQITLAEFAKSLHPVKLKHIGCNQLQASCTKVLSDQLSVLDYSGTVTVYDEGYITYRFVNQKTKRRNSAVIDLFNGKMTFPNLSTQKEISMKSLLSDYGHMNSYDVVLMLLENRVENNISSQQKSKEVVNNNYEFFRRDNGIVKEEFEAGYHKDYLTYIIEQADQQEAKSTKQEIRRFFFSEIKNLSDAQKSVIKLMLEGYDQKEIARLIGKVPASVSESKLRAFHKLQLEWNRTHPNNSVPVIDISKYQKKHRDGKRDLE